MICETNWSLDSRYPKESEQFDCGRTCFPAQLALKAGVCNNWHLPQSQRRSYVERWVWRWWYFFGRCLNVFSAWGSHDATRPKDMHSRLDVLVLQKGNKVMTTSIAHHMSCSALPASLCFTSTWWDILESHHESCTLMYLWLSRVDQSETLAFSGQPSVMFCGETQVRSLLRRCSKLLAEAGRYW